MRKKNLIGKRVLIVSDNENYDRFRERELIVTHASNDRNGNGYDSCMYPELLCSFTDAITGDPIPWSLYEYEFKVQ